VDNNPVVLFVDDDKTISESVVDLLELSGYVALHAANGAAAMEILNTRTPDIIVSDVAMPEMDGFTFHEAVRTNPDWALIPFIFLTARDEKQDIERGYLQGADRYLTKPFDPEDLLVAIETRLRRTQEMRQAVLVDVERMKRQLLNIFGHELRTPISQIYGYVDILRSAHDQTNSSMVQEALGVVDQAVRRLHTLTDDLILQVYLDSGAAQASLKDNLTPVDVGSLLQGSLGSFLDAAGSKQITVENAVPEGIMVLGHPPYLWDLYRRLIDNAIKFGRPGGHVWIHGAQQGSDAHISVKDDGIGIAPEHQEQLFKLFEQIDREKLEQQGVGLGLSIAVSLAQFHGGSIHVSSTIEQGSTFTVVLPLAQPA
jgi:signal transduction histidine kinase